MKISQIGSDYVDDNNYRHIDVWETSDENEEGKTVAIFCEDTGKTFIIDNRYRNETVIKETLEVVKKDYQQSKEVDKTPKITVEKFIEIMEEDLPYESLDNRTVKGLVLMSKYSNSCIGGADHDIIYLEQVDVLIENGITEEDTLKLNEFGFILSDDYDYLISYE